MPKKFHRPLRIELELKRAIQRILLGHLHIAEDATIEEILARVNQLADNAPLLERIGRLLSSQMVTQVNRANVQSWREAAAKASRGREIYLALRKELQGGPVGTRVRDLVSENARLISSIPADVREHLNHEIMRYQQEGLRPEAVAKMLRKRIPELTKSRAALIARTEVSKADTAMTRYRSEDLEIDWYMWQTAEDGRVRVSHRKMDKVLCRWDTPPPPEILAGEKSEGNYGPGEIYNCRCIALPVVSLDVISWPSKVYNGSSIVRMSRKAFLQFSGIKKAA
jgi:SPP1 gp7 family putative phage head morphogenesis protein